MFRFDFSAHYHSSHFMFFASVALLQYAAVLQRGAADHSEAIALNIDRLLMLPACQEWKQAWGEGKSDRNETKLHSCLWSWLQQGCEETK